MGQKNGMNETKMRQEGTDILVVFARFYGIRGAADPQVGNNPYGYTYDGNKNNKIKLQINYKYQSLSYCLLSRSILGCSAIPRLEGLHGGCLTCMSILTKSQNIWCILLTTYQLDEVTNGQKLKDFTSRCQNTRTCTLKQQNYHFETRIVIKMAMDKPID